MTTKTSTGALVPWGGAVMQKPWSQYSCGCRFVMLRNRSHGHLYRKTMLRCLSHGGGPKVAA